MDERLKKKFKEFDQHFVASQIANEYNKNFQEGTDVLFHGMELFRYKGERTANVGWEQAKGNLFEYIEGAKLARNSANAGHGQYDKFVVTDLGKEQGGFGGHTDPDDFRIMKDGEVIARGQAKVNNDPNNTANKFLDPKYQGMERITTSDTVEAVKDALNRKLAQGEISQRKYDEVMTNIRTGLTDERTGISSGGTSTEELRRFRGEDGKIDVDEVIRYSKELERQQMFVEISDATLKGTVGGAVMGGVVTGVTEFFEVYKDRKKLDEALKNTGLAVAKGGARGGLTGFLSSTVRIFAKKQEIPVLSNGTAATALAAGVVDCGVSIYNYVNGEISREQLREELKGTVVKSASAYYFTTALQATLGVGSGVFIPMAIYSITSSMIMATKSIIEQAELNAQQYRRAKELLDEEYLMLHEYRTQLDKELKAFRKDRKETFATFLNSFDQAAFVTADYSAAINSIVVLSNSMKFSLQHKEFAEFKKAMLTNQKFILK